MNLFGMNTTQAGELHRTLMHHGTLPVRFNDILVHNCKIRHLKHIALNAVLRRKFQTIIYTGTPAYLYSMFLPVEDIALIGGRTCPAN